MNGLLIIFPPLFTCHSRFPDIENAMETGNKLRIEAEGHFKDTRLMYQKVLVEPFADPRKKIVQKAVESSLFSFCLNL